MIQVVHPGSGGQKGTGSWIRIRNTVADPHHCNAGPDPAFHFNVDPDPAFHQCYGSEMWIRDPRSEFFLSRIPNPNFFHSGFRFRIKELSILSQKNVSKISEICYSSRIRILNCLPIPNPGVKKAHRIPDPQHCFSFQCGSDFFHFIAFHQSHSNLPPRLRCARTGPSSALFWASKKAPDFWPKSRFQIQLFTLLRIRIRVELPKIVRVNPDPDPQPWFYPKKVITET